MKFNTIISILTTALLLMSSCSPRFVCSNGPLQKRLNYLEDRATEISGNLYRGYAIHVQTVTEHVPYTETDANNKLVTKYHLISRRVETPVAIDHDAMEEELDYLEDEITALQDAAEQEFLACMEIEESKRAK